MILVVSDTSAVSALLQVDQVELLDDLYDQVVIPPAVEQELLRGHSSVPSFVHVHSIDETPELQRRRIILDEGEACAITLAEQINADLLLIDEKKGRLEAEQSGVRYIGLVGVLVEAKRRRFLPAVRPILERLVAEAGFRLAPALYDAVLAEAGEN